MTWVAEWIPSLNIIRKYPGSSPGDASFIFTFFSNSTGHDLHDVIVEFRKSPSGYATTQRVTQPAILLYLFYVIIQQNMNHIKYFSVSFQQRGLVVTVSGWQALGSGFESRVHDRLDSIIVF